MKQVLALAKYGPAAASTRQRLLQFRPALLEAGFAIDFQPLLDDDYVRSLITNVPVSRARLVAAYAHRLASLVGSRNHDLLWIYAELFPGLPAPFERLSGLFGRPVIYDCDDAFFHAHERSALLRDKLKPLIGGARVVTVGNAYLAANLKRWNANVHIMPTVVDTHAIRPVGARMTGPPVIGWIGSPTTWPYVRPLLPLIAELCATGLARFLAVGGGPAAAADSFPGMDARDWWEQREIADLQEMDIGIMPLPDGPWARGKCGYKLIQYMALGLPTVASPVGVNRDILGDGKCGLLATTADEWRTALASLIADHDLRSRLGLAGRARAVRHYSLERHAPTIVSLFEQALS